MAAANLTRWQWRVVILGWVTYAAFYLGRVNLATALPALEADLRSSPDQISLLAGAGLWTYAIGQLVSGWLGHHMDTRRLVFVGIVGSTLINLLFSTASSLPVMVVLALVNGFLQSMGWGPILRTLSDTLIPAQRRRIAGAFGASYVVGNALTWILTGILLRTGQWRLTFVVPPLLMFGIGLVWYKWSSPARSPAEEPITLNKETLAVILRQFWHILIAAVVAGALFNGALIYAPSYVAQSVPLDQAALTAIIFPAFGLIGTAWLGGWTLRYLQGNALQSLVMLLAVTALSRALVFVLPPSPLVAVVVLAAMGVTSYALTNVVLTAVPLTASARLGTSVVAGLMDATHSIGGAAGSTMVGLFLARGDWTLVFGVWTLLPLLALTIIVVALRQQALNRSELKEDYL